MSDEKTAYERLITYAQLVKRSMMSPGDETTRTQIPTLDLVIGMKYAQEHIIQDPGDGSAGQLSVALRAEAARLYERTSSSANMAMKREEVVLMADRIVELSIDARALGVRQFRDKKRLLGELERLIVDMESASDVKTEAFEQKAGEILEWLNGI